VAFAVELFEGTYLGNRFNFQKWHRVIEKRTGDSGTANGGNCVQALSIAECR
jgi:hypothetical protein